LRFFSDFEKRVRADFFGSAAGGLPAEALAKAGGRRAEVASREAAIFHHFGRFQSGNFRFHTKFSFRFWFSPSQTKE